MLYQVIGVERKTGEFTPQDKPGTLVHFDNFVFHCVGMLKEIGVTGQAADQLSIKTVDPAVVAGRWRGRAGRKS